MPETPAPADSMPPLITLPLFWPVAMVAGMEKAKADLALRNLEFEEDLKIHGELKPKLATPNVVRLDLRTMALRDYGRPGGIPTLVNASMRPSRATGPRSPTITKAKAWLRRCSPTASTTSR